MLVVGLSQTSHRKRERESRRESREFLLSFMFGNQLICFYFQRSWETNPFGQVVPMLPINSLLCCGTLNEIPKSEAKFLYLDSHLKVVTAVLFCYALNSCFITRPSSNFPFLSLSPPTFPVMFTVHLHRGLRRRGEQFLFGCCGAGRGGFPPASLSHPAESKHLCVAAGDVMAQKLLKAVSLGNPISGNPDLHLPSPLLLIVIAAQLGKDCKVPD